MKSKKINKQKFWLFNIISIKQFTFLILFFFFFALLGSYLVYAKSKYRLYNLEINSYSSNTVNISFFTPWETSSEIQISKTTDFKDPQIYYDLRSYMIDNTLGGLTYRKDHIFNITNLEPETQYYFNIKTKYNLKHDKESYTFKTTKVSETVNVPMPLYGQILDQKDNVANDILLKLQAYKDDKPVSSILSSYTNLNGDYYFDLANLYSEDFSSKLNLDEKTILKITASNGIDEYNYSISKNEIAPVKTLKFISNSNFPTKSSKSAEDVKQSTFYSKSNGDNEINYELNEGWNALTVPLYKNINTPYTASDLIQLASSQDIQITEVSRWNGEWKGYAKKNNKIYGEDFLLNSNEGYFIKSNSKSKFKLNGFIPNNADAIRILNGWSLIGIPSNIMSAGLNARDFIQKINIKNLEIQSNNITEYHDNTFKSVNITKGSGGESIEFGQDFKLKKEKGYFVNSKKSIIFR